MSWSTNLPITKENETPSYDRAHVMAQVEAAELPSYCAGQEHEAEMKEQLSHAKKAATKLAEFVPWPRFEVNLSGHYGAPGSGSKGSVAVSIYEK